MKRFLILLAILLFAFMMAAYANSTQYPTGAGQTNYESVAK